MDFKTFFILCAGSVNYVLLSIAVFIFLVFLLVLSYSFRKNPKIKKYAQFMFFLFFFLFGAIGYLWYNAIQITIYKHSNISFFEIVYLIFYSLMCAILGAKLGHFFYFVSTKIKVQNQILLINISLIFCVLLLSGILILKPVFDGIKLFSNVKNINKNIGIVRNEIGLQKTNVLGNKNYKFKNFKTCMAFEIRDTLDVFSDGANTITVRQVANSRFYNYILYNNNVMDIKATLISGSKGKKYLVVLALMKPISGISVLLVFNKYGQCVYEELYTNFIYQMSKKNNNEILLSKHELVSNDVAYKPQYIFNFTGR